MAERYITPSKITAWLDCPHYLTLKNQVEDKVFAAPDGRMGAFARLLADKGLAHEAACLAALKAEGRKVLEVPQRHHTETFASWMARIGDPFDGDHDVLFQVPLVHDGIRGIADFLLRDVDNDGNVTWEPLDAKLARKAAKPGHVLQLCFYADAIEAATGRRPTNMHLWLGSGTRESLVVEDFAAYWRRLRGQLRELLDAPSSANGTRPEPCDHCGFCEFADRCDAQWREQDSLIYVAGLRATDRKVLEQSGVTTLAALAGQQGAVEGLAVDRLTRVRDQAGLQLAMRPDDGVKTPPHTVIPSGADPVWGQGFTTLPAPDDGDVFLDFEGHPFWRADRGLFFLFGLIERAPSGEWVYRSWRADDEAEEGLAAGALIDYLATRRQQFPGMHVYHYNHTERSSLEALAAEHGVGELLLADLIDTGAFIDLYVAARNAVQVGTESYGLKYLERLTAYERGHEIDKGAGAVLEYERYMNTGAQDAIDAIAAYNEDDVRATRALRDWLLGQRPEDLQWRDAALPAPETTPELDEQITALHAFGPGTTEHDLGDVLGYWKREWKAHIAPVLALCGADVPDLLEHPDALGGLGVVGVFPKILANGKASEKVKLLRLTVPDQEMTKFEVGDDVVFQSPDGEMGFSKVEHLEDGEVTLAWNDKNQESGWIPQAIVRHKWVDPGPKKDVLSDLAASVLDPTRAPRPCALALLTADHPRFVPGGGPAEGVFTDDLHDMLGWATSLDQSCVAIQGPPGTGKTFRGAHLVRAWVKAGKRVGICATSHEAIDNLLKAVVEHFAEHNDSNSLQAVKRGPHNPGLPGVEHAKTPEAGSRARYNVIAGTTWHFANPRMQDEPVDVLLIDEAGQMALIDALAASHATHNVILLGDPLQLPQVSQASHPGVGGLSVLEHLLADERTISPERGVFLAETRRMHPDVCLFISDEIYQGRLTSHESCATQGTAFGTGLRWIQAHHADRVTESIEEAEIVAAQIRRLLGTSWTNHKGESKPLAIGDFLVVAPYNDQVDLLRSHLDATPETAGVAVGTVDKFQGQEAPIVFFTMTTSSATDMPRGADFLFSSNRFNVAISRARCLAYLVCTKELLDTRGRTVDEMRLIAKLCAFVERAEAVTPSS
ncbi:MAG: TM0106 family RecB-like putative nuclease [Mycobacteriaceae bacterium]